jgi:hypothetical protein
MANNEEYHILLKNEEYEKLKNQIILLQEKNKIIEKRLHILENKKNFIQYTFNQLNNYWEMFLFFMMEQFIEIQAE